MYICLLPAKVFIIYVFNGEIRDTFVFVVAKTKYHVSGFTAKTIACSEKQHIWIGWLTTKNSHESWPTTTILPLFQC